MAKRKTASLPSFPQITQGHFFFFFKRLGLWIELCPNNVHVEVLNPTVTVFGDRVYNCRKKLWLNEVTRL